MGLDRNANKKKKKKKAAVVEEGPSKNQRKILRVLGLSQDLCVNLLKAPEAAAG